MEILTRLLHDLVESSPTQIYLITGLILASEAGLLLGVLAPAATTLFTLGVLAHSGHVSLAPAVLFACLAAMIGDSVGYWEGRLLGERAKTGWLERRIGTDRRQRMDRLFHRFGGRTVMIGRWIAFVRTVMPRLAGAARLPYRRFLMWNGIGIAVWIPGSIALGYFAGSSYQRLLAQAEPIVICGVVLAVAVVATGIWFAVRHIGGRGLVAPADRNHAARPG